MSVLDGSTAIARARAGGFPSSRVTLRATMASPQDAESSADQTDHLATLLAAHQSRRLHTRCPPPCASSRATRFMAPMHDAAAFRARLRAAATDRRRSRVRLAVVPARGTGRQACGSSLPARAVTSPSAAAAAVPLTLQMSQRVAPRVPAGVMACVTRLHIKDCPGLTALPSCIGRLALPPAPLRVPM